MNAITGQPSRPASMLALSRSLTNVLCICGQVGLTFHGTPLLALDCACCDCRQAREFEATLGGPPSKSALGRAVYLPNDVSTVSELDITTSFHLSHLRKEARSTRLVSSCCHSTLAVDHPAYGGKLVMVPRDSCNLQAKEIAPLARIYLKDWPDDEPLPPLEPPTLPTIRGDEPDLAERAEVYRTVFHSAKEPAPRQGLSIQELFSALGPPSVLGLTKMERF